MKYRTRNWFSNIFHTMDIIRRVVLGLVFWLLVILLITILIESRSPRVKKNSVLVISPEGILVDDSISLPTFQGILVGQPPSETHLGSLIRAIELGQDDPKIVGIWLQLDGLSRAGAASAGELSDALKEFSESGKPIISSADTYNTSRYRIASAADYIIVDRLGEVFISGYGSWRIYMAEGLDKFGGDVNLFRSGESKSAAEGFLLNGMSDIARQNEEQLLGDLWSEWIDSVSGNRGVDPIELAEWIKSYDLKLMGTGGNAPESARSFSLVDGIEVGGVVQNRLYDLFGENYHTVDAEDYVLRQDRIRLKYDTIAVVPIGGTLVYGKGDFGQSGSDSIIDAIERAREIPNTVAIVLRIDSPGGDVRAAEAIRRSVQETKEDWNLPVVASLGDMAASGGYWIALESELIVTRPDSITGSIGVFMLSLSFQKGLADILGIHIDGIGTTPWSGMGHLGRYLDDRAASIYESGVMDIDTMFKSLVAERRGLGKKAVANLSGGIPWSGRRALELGLVDHLGGLREACLHAAELSGSIRWQTVHVTKFQELRKKLLSQILWGIR